MTKDVFSRRDGDKLTARRHPGKALDFPYCKSSRLLTASGGMEVEMKKIMYGMVTGVMIGMLAAGAAFAAETTTETPEEEKGGFLSILLGEDDILSDLAGKAKGGLDMVKEEASKALDGIASGIQTLDELIDTESLKDYASDFLRKVFVGGSDDFSAWDEMFAMVESIRNAETEYIREYNAGNMDEGDVQIITDSTIFSAEDTEQEEYRDLTCMVQDNYRLDDENQLLLVSGARDIVLFTLRGDEKNQYTVTDAEFAQDGENYMPSIEVFCEEVGVSVDECMESINISDYMVLLEMKKYLDEHPEITGIEYGGEIRSADDLQELGNDWLEENYGDAQTEA